MSNVKMPEPDSYMFQHEETGLVDFVDRQQVEWGYEKNNPRWQRIGGAFTEEQMKAYAQAVRDEALEQAAKRAESMHHDSAPHWVALRIRELKRDRS